jgi:hypothetical protein
MYVKGVDWINLAQDSNEIGQVYLQIPWKVKIVLTIWSYSEY